MYQFPPLFASKGRPFAGNPENLSGRVISQNLPAVPSEASFATTLVEVEDASAWQVRVEPVGLAGSTSLP